MTYNGPDMIEKKTQMAIEAGIAGVMMFVFFFFFLLLLLLFCFVYCCCFIC